MKGVELFASVVALFFLIGISAMMGGVVIVVLNLVDAPSTQPINYEMVMSPIYPPIKYESMMLSYLELTDASGFQVKKILLYSALQNNIDSILIDGKEVTTLKQTTSDSITKWLPENTYIMTLNVNGRVYTISDNKKTGQALNLRHVSVPIYIDSENTGLYIDSLNIKLDFYVQ